MRASTLRPAARPKEGQTGTLTGRGKPQKDQEDQEGKEGKRKMTKTKAKVKTKPGTTPKKKSPAKPPSKTVGTGIGAGAVKPVKVPKNPERVIRGLETEISRLRTYTGNMDQEVEFQSHALDAHLSYLESRLGKKATRLLVENWEKHPNGAIFGAKRLGAQARKLDLLTIASNTSWKNDVEDLRTRLRAAESRITQLQTDHAGMREDRDGAIRDMERLLKEHRKMELDRDGAIAMLKNTQDEMAALVRNADGAANHGARVVLVMEDGILTAPYSLAPIPVQILVVNKDDAKMLPAKEVVDCAIYEIFAEPLSPDLYAEHAHDTAAEIVSACSDPKIRETAQSGGAGRVFDAVDERVASHLEGVDTTPPAGDSGEGKEAAP